MYAPRHQETLEEKNFMGSTEWRLELSHTVNSIINRTRRAVDHILNLKQVSPKRIQEFIEKTGKIEEITNKPFPRGDMRKARAQAESEMFAVEKISNIRKIHNEEPSTEIIAFFAALVQFYRTREHLLKNKAPAHMWALVKTLPPVTETEKFSRAISNLLMDY